MLDDPRVTKVGRCIKTEGGWQCRRMGMPRSRRCPQHHKMWREELRKYQAKREHEKTTPRL